MMTEKGTLPVGVEVDGVTHRDFTVRAQIVADSVEVLEGPDAERAMKSDSYYAVCLMAKQIVSLGALPLGAITPSLVMQMPEVDFHEINAARGRLERMLRSFRSQEEKAPGNTVGAHENGANVSAGDKHE